MDNEKPRYITSELRLPPEIAYDEERLKKAVAESLGAHPMRVTGLRVARRSIDARQKRVMVNLLVRVWLDVVPEATSLITPVEYAKLPADAPEAVVVGAGPAGLFAALRLIEAGVRPILLERGKSVDERGKDMARIARENVVDPDSNYCFGEGGAGAYSDGKLYTRSKKRGSVEKILNIFAQHGAPEDILVDAHPHIGTDRLPRVIAAMRRTIIDRGGRVRFSTRVDNLIVEDGRCAGVVTSDGEELRGPVILATGHSARDVYSMLAKSGIAIEPKGIAVGVRLEHPQNLIDQLQYHSPKGRGRYLPAAEYSMLTRVDGRGVYSFCMCPGGVIIPAATGPGQLVVNGMSPASRGGRWANSGMVVEVLPEDIPGTDALKMMRFQEMIEGAFYRESGGSQNSAAQRMKDFVNGADSETLPPTSYAPGIHPARVDRLLPMSIAGRLRQAFIEFGRKQKGFLTNEAVLIGAETRTSAPVRVPRDGESLCHIGLPGLYPCGEGAGYAGGIVSAAIDGERCAEALAASL
ncbi:MAG: NAD(P)/FAD-dependent oxidoreductase [[Clostridium] fimetarium]|nr:NAD(P)/FAD-dependent oxidoreductase [Alistipes timonensis]MCM1405002.1 NAD(P)/FAD-dependent oxidoreductase [[Clostridium] fimetarium]